MSEPDPIYGYIDDKIADAVASLRTELLDEILPLGAKYDQTLSLLVEAKALLLSQNAVNALLLANKREAAEKVFNILGRQVAHLRGRLEEAGDPLKVYSDWHNSSRKELATILDANAIDKLLPQTRDLTLRLSQEHHTT